MRKISNVDFPSYRYENLLTVALFIMFLGPSLNDPHPTCESSVNSEGMVPKSRISVLVKDDCWFPVLITVGETRDRGERILKIVTQSIFA